MNIRQINDKNVWEDFVSQQKYTSPFQSWNWGEFEKSLGNKFERFGMYDREKLVGLLPVKHVKAKRGRYLYLRHGPVFDYSQENLWANFIEFIRQKAKKERYWFVRFSPLVMKADEERFKQMAAGVNESPMHDVDAELAWVLDVTKSEEEILAGMRKNTRYYVRKAEREGVKVIKTQDPKYIDDFYKIFADTIKRQKWSAYSKEYIEREFETFVKDDQTMLFLAEYKGKFIAASFFLYYGNESVYHHSGSLTAYSKIPASYAIQWEAIKEAKRRGLKWHNFWGISPLVKEGDNLMPDANHPWAGLSLFKLGFGGHVRQLTHAKDLPISPLYYLTRIFETIERKRRGY